MQNFHYVLNIIYYITGLYLFIYSLYWCLLAITSLFYSPKRKLSRNENDNISIDKLLILFPAYQPNFRLIEAVKAAKKLHSNTEITEILVLLQDDVNNVKNHLYDLDVNIIEKSFKDTIGNPYHEALRFCAEEAIAKEASHILLLDKDNIIYDDFIDMIEIYGDTKADVWQGKRIALNMNSNPAIYDGLSEKLNDSLLREAKSTLGLPPELSGSALLFKINAFFSATKNLDSRAPGMDKNLLIQLLLDDKKISYVPTAIVLEEKTENNEVIKTQRMRWFGNQYFNAFYWGKALLLKSKTSTIDYLITLYRPPRSLQIVILPILMMFELLFSTQYLLTTSTLLTYLGILIFILKENIWLNALKIASSIPEIAFNNVKSAIRGSSKSQQGKFIATERIINDQKSAA